MQSGAQKIGKDFKRRKRLGAIKGSNISARGFSAEKANEVGLACIHGHVGRWVARYTKDKGRHYRTCRDCDLRRTKMNMYGLCKKKYDFLLAWHNGKCFICRTKKPLSIDHNHKTGEVRALLCQRCNTLVGYMECEFSERALIYLKMFKEKLIAWQ